METFEHLETHSVIDLQVSVAGVDVSTGVEVFSELQAIRSVAGSGVGAPQGAEARHQGLPQVDIASADEHSKQVMGNGQVTNHFEPPVGCTPGSIVEASTTRGRPTGLLEIQPIPLFCQCCLHTLVVYGCLCLARR